MKAHLNHTMNRGFLITEEAIIKIHDIISKRIEGKFPDTVPMYKVYRIDSLVFETANYKDMVHEENSTRNLISRIQILIEEETFSLELDFDKKYNTTIEIEAEDKDFAYLLFSDIKDYLTTEVLKFRSFQVKLKIMFLLAMSFLPLFLIIPLTSIRSAQPLSKQGLQDLISTENLSQKLNYIIESNTHARNSLTNMPLLFVLVLSLLVCIPLLVWLIAKAYPRNLFCLGKEKSRYNRLCSVRSKFYWVILGGLAVTVVGGLLIKYG